MPRGKHSSQKDRSPQRARRVHARLSHQKVCKREPLPKEYLEPGRVWPWVSRAGRGLTLFLLLNAGLTVAFHLAVSADSFKVRQAEISGNRHLSRVDILRTMGIGTHSNTLGLPVGRLEQRLQGLSWIESASVRRALPHTVRVTIREKVPRSIAAIGGRLFLLDKNLMPLGPASVGDAPPLPVLTGFAASDFLQPGPQAKVLLAAARRALVLSAGSGPPLLGRLAEIHLDRVWGVSLVFNRLGAVVRLGGEDFAARLAKLCRITADLAARGELSRATLIDLDHQRRVVVRLGKGRA